MNRKISIAAIAILAAVVLSLLTTLHQRENALTCDYDGTKISPVYEVDIKLKDGRAMKFCSIFCAKAWFRENSAKTDSVTVTDEITGEGIDAGIAIFVVSNIVTVEANQNRMHAFKDDHYAQTHAKQHHGKVADNPFKP